ncbi:hypothetical protein BOTBODRAFT_64803 [Botryobasidium botryosum FD-172 SS1]|uniref:Uncharacterized protein n=1 Tax=Botryobasidium botryosum (strain FD-172 SS1) TaxID=930990 RepID=A0A067ML66_BOTB1|nr:hypothetical protein BOTBODRAFT_64803 [Botryobasidium botryosum FD-172 SS1]
MDFVSSPHQSLTLTPLSYTRTPGDRIIVVFKKCHTQLRSRYENVEDTRREKRAHYACVILQEDIRLHLFPSPMSPRRASHGALAHTGWRQCEGDTHAAAQHTLHLTRDNIGASICGTDLLLSNHGPLLEHTSLCHFTLRDHGGLGWSTNPRKNAMVYSPLGSADLTEGIVFDQAVSSAKLETLGTTIDLLATGDISRPSVRSCVSLSKAAPLLARHVFRCFMETLASDRERGPIDQENAGPVLWVPTFFNRLFCFFSWRSSSFSVCANLVKGAPCQWLELLFLLLRSKWQSPDAASHSLARQRHPFYLCKTSTAA